VKFLTSIYDQQQKLRARVDGPHLCAHVLCRKCMHLTAGFYTAHPDRIKSPKRKRCTIFPHDQFHRIVSGHKLPSRLVLNLRPLICRSEMSLTIGIHVLTTSTPQQDIILKSIVCIHASCILYDHTMATFIPPLSFQKMYQRWKGLLAETASNSRVVIISISEVSSRQTPNTELKPAFGFPTWPVLDGTPGLEVSGVVSLSLPISETGPFRAIVQNFFVSSLHRRKRIGSTLLSKLEEEARENGRWNLMLDTTVGTAAEKVYPKLGWERLGVVKDYGISPKDGRLLDEVWFWKDLRGLAQSGSFSN